MKYGFIFFIFMTTAVLAQTPGSAPAAAVTEATLQQALVNPALTQPQKLQIYTALINLYQQAKAYDKLVQTAERYLAIDPSKSVVRLQQAQALALLGKDAEAIAVVQEKMRRDALTLSNPTEAELRVLVRSYARLKNKSEVQQTLLLLLIHYSQSQNVKAYWQDFLTQRIDTLQGMDKPDKRVIYGFYRLLQATGNLTEAEDITEAAVLAIDAGQPRQALQILALNEKPDLAQLKIKDRAEKLAKADVQSSTSPAPWEVVPAPERWQELSSLWRLLAK
jgi:lipopolysaccharide biosynthesis regulator YciM